MAKIKRKTNTFFERKSLGVPARAAATFHVLKRTEGGPGSKEKMRQLKAAGIKCEAVRSIYVGHSGIFVMGTKRELERAEKIIFPGRKK